MVDKIRVILKRMRENPRGIKYSSLCRVCDYHFGEPRQKGGSHRIYKIPWQGDPRINIQDDHGLAKPYQIRQVLRALARLEKNNYD